MQTEIERFDTKKYNVSESLSPKILLEIITKMNMKRADIKTLIDITSCKLLNSDYEKIMKHMDESTYDHIVTDMKSFGNDFQLTWEDVYFRYQYVQS